jgi:hypothetical protein
MNKLKIILATVIIMYGPVQVQGQNILIDRGVRVEGLWCFPLATDSTQYLYLPDQSHLTVDKQNNPQFSFVRYVSENLSPDTSGKSIRQAKGGGILHFLLSYDTDERKVKKRRSN